MKKEDYKIAYENVMIANKMLEQENKQLQQAKEILLEDRKKATDLFVEYKQRINKAIEYIKKVFPTDFCEMEYESAIKLLEILGDGNNE